ESYDPVDTPMVEKSKLDEDRERKAVDPSYYRGMIGTLLYLTASRHDLQFACVPELTNEEIRNSNAYKEYYAIATGTPPPKPKASVRRTRSSSNTSITPPTAVAGPRLTNSAKGKQAAKASKAKSLSALFEDGDGDEKDEGDDGKEGDDDDDEEDDDGEEGDDDDADQEIKRDDDKDDEEEGKDDEQEYNEETRDEESFDTILKTPKNSDDKGNDDDDLGLNIGGEEGYVKEEKEDELYRDVNIKQGMGIQATLEVEDSHVTQTPVNPDGQQQSSSVSSEFLTSMLNLTLDVVMQTNQFAGAVSAILEIVQLYMDQRMNEAVKVAVQIQSGRLRDEAQRQNDKFLKTVDENMQKIIKEQVKEQVKILIKKIEGNKSIQRSDEHRNLYKAFIESYEFDKIILDTYREIVTLKRHRDDDADKDEEPSAGPDRGSKRCREGKRIIAVTELKIVEWHNYKHLDWITMRRDDDKLYKFKEGNFKRLRIQDIEDMLLLLVQEKLTNLTIEECFAFNVSL
nr:hypothetical protein [Tanacetum cinerariifolium]